jgi:Ca-activated chloride channel family protein
MIASASVDPESSAGKWADAIRGLYGALRVRRLESLVAAPSLRNIPEILERMGLASKVRETLYPENERLAAADIAEFLVRESLAAGIPCSKTAFVAVREEAGVKVSERLVVPNALPRGWDAGFAAPMPCMVSSKACPPDSTGASTPYTIQYSVSSRISARSRVDADSPARADSSPSPSGKRGVSGFLSRIGFAGKRRSEEDAFTKASAEPEASVPARERLLFDGPVAHGEALATLFDGVAGVGLLAGLGFLRALVVAATFAEEADAGEAEIWILVNGVAAAKVRLADLLRLGGRRPLNIRLRDGDRVSVELSGASAAGIERLRVSAG